MSYDPGQPYPPSESPPVTPAQPSSLSTAISQLPAQYWRVITQPRPATYADEQGKASWSMVWTQLVIAGILTEILLLISFYTILPTAMRISAQNSLANNPVLANNPQAAQQATAIAQRTATVFQVYAIPISLGYLLLGLISFFLIVFFLQLIAKGFGGRGTFVQYAYCTLLIAIPLGLISGIIGIVNYGLSGPPPMAFTPTSALFNILGLVVAIYHFALQIFMTMGVFRLSGGRATASVILGGLVGFIIIFIALAIISFIIGIAMFATVGTH